jgi:hypothetical protein
MMVNASMSVDAPSSSAYPLPTLVVDPDRPDKSLPGNMYNGLVGLRDDWINEKVVKTASAKDMVRGDSLIPFVEHLMQEVPYPSTADHWKSKHEAIKLAEVVFDCITLMMNKCRCLLRRAHAKRLSAYLFRLCYVFDAWTYFSIPHEEGVPTPKDLKRKAMDSLVAALLNLGQSAEADDATDLPAWQLAKEMLMQLLDTCEGASL